MRYLIFLVFLFQLNINSAQAERALTGTGNNNNNNSSGALQNAVAPVNVYGQTTCPAGYELRVNVFNNNTAYCVPSSNTVRNDVNINNVDDNRRDKSLSNDSTSSCKSAYSAAVTACDGTSYSGLAQQLVATFSSYKNAGNIKEACASAKQISQMGLIANGGFATACKLAQKKCLDACENSYEEINSKMDASDAAEKCQSMTKQWTAGMMQGMQDVSSYLASSACEQAVSGKCLGDNAYTDSDCVQFCTKAENLSNPKCQSSLAMCSNSTYAAQNAQYCTCLQNPYATGCSGMTLGPTNTTGSTNDPLAGLDLNPDNGYDTSLKDSNQKGAGTETNPASSSGFSPGSGSSFPIQGDGGGTGTADSGGKDVIQGVSGGAGAGIITGGGGYADAPGGRSGGSGSGYKSDINLRDYLPGAKKDPRRAPASNAYGDPTITSANGLTNFQKVTRKMQELRGELMP